MKKYISPEIEIKKFENEEVLGGSSTNTGTGQNETEIIYNLGRIF